MTLHQFNQLSLKEQFEALLRHRMLLDIRGLADNKVAHLYALHHFFVEVTFHTVSNQLLLLRSFSTSDGLEDYAMSVQLPDWMA